MKKLERIAAAVLTSVLIASLIGCAGGGANKTAESETEFMLRYGLNDNDAEKIRSSSAPFRVLTGGYVGERVSKNEKNWLLTAVNENPYILNAIENRNVGQKYDIVTWFGEFPGAFLYGAAECYALTRSQQLYTEIEKLISELERLQADNGYLGDYPDSEQFDEKYWDVGAHFFMLQGLVEWYETSDSERALNMADKIASALYRYCCVRNNAVSVGQLMVISPLCRLQLIKPSEEKRKLINYLAKLSDEKCGFYRGGLDRTDYYVLPVHRWENMFDVQGLGLLGKVYGDGTYTESMLNLRNSLLKTDRHITGGMTTGETAAGTKWADGPIETCAVVAWEDLNATCYLATADSLIADELELTFLNAVLGAQCEDGKTCTYDTPRNGRKISSSVELSWQATPLSPDFNCCAANFARGIGLLSKWATYTGSDALRVNYYGEGEIIASTPGGNLIALSQKTGYPSDGNIRITLDLEQSELFALCLRIPFWADGSTVSVNGGEPVSAQAGEYFCIEREWSSGDVVELNLGMCLHFMKGENEKEGKAALYYGPCLMAMDGNVNKGFNGVAPTLDVTSLSPVPVKNSSYLVAMKVRTADGNEIGLVDFASAGRGGAVYASLFPGENLGLLRGETDWGLKPTCNDCDTPRESGR